MRPTAPAPTAAPSPSRRRSSPTRVPRACRASPSGFPMRPSSRWPFCCSALRSSPRRALFTAARSSGAATSRAWSPAAAGLVRTAPTGAERRRTIGCQVGGRRQHGRFGGGAREPAAGAAARHRRVPHPHHRRDGRRRLRPRSGRAGANAGRCRRRRHARRLEPRRPRHRRVAGRAPAPRARRAS